MYAGGVESASALVRRGEAAPRDFMLLSGYSGWGPWQLQQELRGGTWLPVAASQAVIMDCLQGGGRPQYHTRYHSQLGSHPRCAQHRTGPLLVPRAWHAWLHAALKALLAPQPCVVHQGPTVRCLAPRFPRCRVAGLESRPGGGIPPGRHQCGTQLRGGEAHVLAAGAVAGGHRAADAGHAVTAGS